MKISELHEMIENNEIIREMLDSACPHCLQPLHMFDNLTRTNHIKNCCMRKHTQGCIIKQGESGEHYYRKARFLETCCWCHLGINQEK